MATVRLTEFCGKSAKMASNALCFCLLPLPGAGNKQVLARGTLWPQVQVFEVKHEEPSEHLQSLPSRAQSRYLWEEEGSKKTGTSLCRRQRVCGVSPGTAAAVDSPAVTVQQVAGVAHSHRADTSTRMGLSGEAAPLGPET